MTSSFEHNLYNPIDTIENIFARDNVVFDRRDNNDLVVEISGKWGDILVFFAYEESLRCLHMSCLLDIETQTHSKDKVFELLAILNESLWLGHFSYWREQNMPLFKHSVILQDDEELFYSKISKIIELSIMECERVYPIFNAVICNQVSPSQALFNNILAVN